MPQYGQDVWKKLNHTLFKTLESATQYCQHQSITQIELVHWLYHIHQLQDSDWYHILNYYKIDASKIEEDLFNYISSFSKRKTAHSHPAWSESVITSIEKAWFYASVTRHDYCIRSAWLLAILLTTPDYRQELLRYSPEFGNIPVGKIESEFQDLVRQSAESYEQALDGSQSNIATENANQNFDLLHKYCNNLSALAAENKLDPVIGRDTEVRTIIDILLRRRQNNPLLVGEAGVGKTAVIEGLAQEIHQKNVPDSLKDSVIFSLDIGSLLAGASMKGEFEDRLKKLIDEILHYPQPIILFVDEVHTLVGAGGNAGTGDAANLLKPILARSGLKIIGATTWSEYKKHIEKDPALVRRFQQVQIKEPSEEQAIDMLRAISEVLTKHYQVLITDEAITAAVQFSHRYIPTRQLPDKAISLLDTACAKIVMSTSMPSKHSAWLMHKIESAQRQLLILQNEARLSSKSHQSLKDNLQIEIDALQTTLEKHQKEWQIEFDLSKQIQDIRQNIMALSPNEEPQQQNQNELHQKIILLENELAQLQNEEPNIFVSVDENIVAEVVAEWTGIPVGRMLQDEINTVANIQTILSERVLGQDQALSTISKTIQIAKAGFLEKNKPNGVFLLTGPSGVGKTETALALADALFGSEQNLITINMSEYQESHTISSLKGSTPGYVGYGEGGRLTEAVRKKPYSIVLLDEMEKAHPDIHELFYQVFDKGWMEDGEGRYIDFRNTTILMTSNAGSEEIDFYCADHGKTPAYEKIISNLTSVLSKTFPIAFLGRVTLVPYLPIAQEQLLTITILHLNKIIARVKDAQGIDLKYTDNLLQWLVKKCFSHPTGIRHVLYLINTKILPLIVHIWFANSQDSTPNLSLLLDVIDGEIVCI